MSRAPENPAAALAPATRVLPAPAPLVDLVLDGLGSEHSRRAYRHALEEFFHWVSDPCHRRGLYPGRRPALPLPLQVLLDVGEIDDILDLLEIGFHGVVALCNN